MSLRSISVELRSGLWLERCNSWVFFFLKPFFCVFTLMFRVSASPNFQLQLADQPPWLYDIGHFDKLGNSCFSSMLGKDPRPDHDLWKQRKPESHSRFPWWSCWCLPIAVTSLNLCYLWVHCGFWFVPLESSWVVTHFLEETIYLTVDWRMHKHIETKFKNVHFVFLKNDTWLLSTGNLWWWLQMSNRNMSGI